jgi:hypothetical protein
MPVFEDTKMEKPFMDLRETIRFLKGNLKVDKHELAQFRIVLYEAVDLFNSVSPDKLELVEKEA